MDANGNRDGNGPTPARVGLDGNMPTRKPAPTAFPAFVRTGRGNHRDIGYMDVAASAFPTDTPAYARTFAGRGETDDVADGTVRVAFSAAGGRAIIARVDAIRADGGTADDAVAAVVAAAIRAAADGHPRYADTRTGGYRVWDHHVGASAGMDADAITALHRTVRASVR